MNHDNLNRKSLAGMIDHAVLAPQAGQAELFDACNLVNRYQVASLCVKPCDVAMAVRFLNDIESSVVVSTVIGFPHGSTTTQTKAAEAVEAIRDGASELDMVLNIGRLREGKLDFVREEIAAVVNAAQGRIVKVILECCYLNRDQMVAGCTAAIHAGAHFVKTSTGFAASGATVEDVRFLRSHVPKTMGVKAAGGIRTLADTLALIKAGATRIGTSRTKDIVERKA